MMIDDNSDRAPLAEQLQCARVDSRCKDYTDVEHCAEQEAPHWYPQGAVPHVII